MQECPHNEPPNGSPCNALWVPMIIVTLCLAIVRVAQHAGIMGAQPVSSLELAAANEGCVGSSIHPQQHHKRRSCQSTGLRQPCTTGTVRDPVSIQATKIQQHVSQFSAIIALSSLDAKANIHPMQSWSMICLICACSAELQARARVLLKAVRAGHQL